jgi:hypothetical protein
MAEIQLKQSTDDLLFPRKGKYFPSDTVPLLFPLLQISPNILIYIRYF